MVDSSSEEEETNERTAIVQTESHTRYYTLHTKVELGQMTALYFNKWGRMFFYISLCIYLYGDLAIYTTAIGKSVLDLICTVNTAQYNTTNENFTAHCWTDSSVTKIDVYRIIVGIFALIVGPFTYFNLQKTKYLQVLTTSMRWCAFTIMVTLACVHIQRSEPHGHPSMFDFNGVPALIGASVYSFMCHHSLPGLIAPFSNKQHVVWQLGLDYLLICGFYILLSLTGIFAFKNLNDLYTLNFLPSSEDNFGMKAILYFLSLFPVFTLSTSFPIISITLQNNLKALFLDVNNLETYNFFSRRLIFPTVAVVPPIIIALSTHDLHSLVKFTGAYAGACIQYFIPALLVWAARRNCKLEFGGGSRNKYKSWFQGYFWIMFILCWSITCIILVTINFTS